MSKIQRYQGDVRAFASAQQSGERYIFGDTTTESDSLSDQLTTDYLRGWAVISASDEPPLEWFNAVAFTATQFIAYLHQSGIPEWNGEQEYHDGSQANYNGQIYTCLTDNHTSVTTPNTDPTNWKKASAGDADNADKLDGQHGSFYRDASNLNSGTVPTARLPEATATSKGVSRQATAQEAIDGADVDAYIPPDLVHAAFNQYGLGGATSKIQDLNNSEIESGFYYSDSSAANNPTSRGGALIVNRYNENVTNQIFLPQGSSDVWVRSFLVDTWSQWLNTLNSSDKATTAQAQAGSDDDAYLTSLKANQLVSQLFSTATIDSNSNYYVFPPDNSEKSLILQWGTTGATVTGETITLPIAFPNQFLRCFATRHGTIVASSAIKKITNGSFVHYHNEGGSGEFDYLAIGY